MIQLSQSLENQCTIYFPETRRKRKRKHYENSGGTTIVESSEEISSKFSKDVDMQDELEMKQT